MVNSAANLFVYLTTDLPHIQYGVGVACSVTWSKGNKATWSCASEIVDATLRGPYKAGIAILNWS